MTELLPCPFCGGEAVLCHPSFGRPYVCCDANFCSGPKNTDAEAIAAWNRRAPVWQPIATAPKDKDILVWYDNEADPYQCPEDPTRLTDYAAWADGGPFMDGEGMCIAKWQEAFWESVDEYGGGYYLPAYWFALQNDDYESVVNPTHWQPLPAPPQEPTNE